jgi:2,4-dienoyl-CoA reductase-like NADH-dependent reductase (Old Yellow Enzyme family)
VREAIGRDKIITLRLSQDGVDDFTGAWPGVSYARAVGRALADVDADALHWASFSWSTNRAADEKTPVPVALRSESGKPMIVNGGIAEAADVEAAVAAGAGDLLAVGRPLFAQPDWPYIIRSGAAYDWAPFDRKYVIRPPYDYSYAYPHDLPQDDWDPDVTKRRVKHWLA